MERATSIAGPWAVLATLSTDGNAMGPMLYPDAIGNTNLTFYYRVKAINVVGDSDTLGFPTINSESAYTAPVSFSSAYPDEIGVFQNGTWYLDKNGNGVFDSGVDAMFHFGIAGDMPIAGDWNGDGYDEVGVKRGNRWYLDYNGNGTWDAGDVTIPRFGLASDVPIVGDWNGDGKDDIGVKRGNRWFLDYNNTGAWDTGDITYNNFGLSSDLPVAGDWNADGYDEIGVKREPGGTWITMAPVPGMPVMSPITTSGCILIYLLQAIGMPTGMTKSG